MVTYTDRHTNTHARTLSDLSGQTGAPAQISNREANNWKSLLVFSGTPWRGINTFKHLNCRLKTTRLNTDIFISPSLTLTHKGSMQGILGSSKAQFSAHHTGCSSVPHVIYDSPPFPISEYFYPTLAQSGSSLEAHRLYRAAKGCNSVYSHTVWLCYRHKSFHLTTTGYGAWGLPEEMRANWGPGTHLTTACLLFLQGVRLRGIDSCAWHSDRLLSVPRQWTFSTQNPFFLAIKLNLERGESKLDNMVYSKSFEWRPLRCSAGTWALVWLLCSFKHVCNNAAIWTLVCEHFNTQVYEDDYFWNQPQVAIWGTGVFLALCLL